MHQHLRRALYATIVLIVPAGLVMTVRAEKTSPHSGPTHVANGSLVIPLTPTGQRSADARVAAPTAATVTLTKRDPVKSGASFLRYSVQPGDTLSSIGQRYGLKVREIKQATGIQSDALKLGQVLRIPLTGASGSNTSNVATQNQHRLPPGVIVYSVKAKESLSNIRSRYGVSESDIINANPNLPSLDHLKPGSSLLIPTTHKGLLIRLPKGASLLDVSARHRVSLTKLVGINGARDPRDLSAGDLVLVPGAQNKASRQRLERKRAAERRYEVVQAAQVEAKAQAKLEAKAQAKAQAKLEAKREALRARQRAAVGRAQRASIRVVPDQTATVGGYRWPMRSFQITSGYGRRSFWIGRSNFHTGIDLAARYGAPIYAAKSGYVIESGWGKFGLNARISTGRGVTNIYGHMSRVRVRVGEFVNRGELIGYEGCTGICTGSHLHFEVQVSGAPRNPLRFLP
jgi:murein DD-endopeptidase MepM/ murein hydrolase activator NlpD